jgi:SHS2 domain-containing protein
MAIMSEETLAGFRERPHTADWALDVWAADLPSLLRHAALGMYALMGVRTQSSPRVTHHFDLPLVDPESLLVSFLSELLYLGGRDGIGFDTFDLSLTDSILQAAVGGAPIVTQAKEIKAVTYHNLQVRHTRRGLETTIVFDV